MTDLHRHVTNRAGCNGNRCRSSQGGRGDLHRHVTNRAGCNAKWQRLPLWLRVASLLLFTDCRYCAFPGTPYSGVGPSAK